jgi:hypothetical protein
MSWRKFRLVYALTGFLILWAGSRLSLELIESCFNENLSHYNLDVADSFFHEEYFFRPLETVSRLVIQISRIIRYNFFVLLCALFLTALYRAAFAFSFRLSRLRQCSNTKVIALFLGGRAPPWLS